MLTEKGGGRFIISIDKGSRPETVAWEDDSVPPCLVSHIEDSC